MLADVGWQTARTDYRELPRTADREKFPVLPGIFPDPVAIGLTTAGVIRNEGLRTRCSMQCRLWPADRRPSIRFFGIPGPWWGWPFYWLQL